MKIQVVYKDGTEDSVEQKFLDILLYIGEVEEFRRSDHWVNVAEDPIRKPRILDHYSGEERRHHKPTSFETVFA